MGRRAGISQLIPAPTMRLLRIRYPPSSLYKVSPVLRFLLLERPAEKTILILILRDAERRASLTVRDSLGWPCKKGRSESSRLLDK